MTGEETVSINGADFQPDELDLGVLGAVITLPKDAAFSDASMELVTELPEQHPERAVALLQDTYNDRKIGQAVSFWRRKALSLRPVKRPAAPRQRKSLTAKLTPPI